MLRLAVMLLALLAARSTTAQTDRVTKPETVSVQNGDLRLRGLLWRPEGRGPFPGVVFNHGNGASAIDSAQVEVIAHRDTGPTFARHGYELLFLFRRGEGLSRGEGVALSDALAAEGARNGANARRLLRDRLLVTEQLDDVRAGIAFLRQRPEVDRTQIVVAGHSFGGMLAILAAERDSTVRAVVDFAGAAASWNGSPELRARLLQAVERLTVPTFFIHAANDISIAPGQEMAAVMAHDHQPYQLKIYPPEGSSPADGHLFVYRATTKWEPDVFGFLEQYLRQNRPHNER